jgi:hypothetical protein
VSDTPELSYAALAVTMELSRLRSTLMVGAALVAKFPTEEAWWGLLSDPEYVESLNALAEVLNDIKQDVEIDEAATPEAVATAAERHYARAAETIEVVAERLQVPTEDLLNVLITL